MRTTNEPRLKAVKVRLAVYDRLDPRTPLEFAGRIYDLETDVPLMRRVIRLFEQQKEFAEFSVAPFVVRQS